MRSMNGFVVCVLLGVMITGCSSYKQSWSGPRRTQLEDRADRTVTRFKDVDPTLDEFFESAAGYVVFPKVVKGGAGLGGAHGNGVVYQDGEVVGYAELSQGTVGAQLGGQSYSEIIFFQSVSDLEDFQEGETHFAAQASAVAAAEGAGANADYSDGVAIFTRGAEGLMFEATVGGQQLDYYPKLGSDTPEPSNRSQF